MNTSAYSLSQIGTRSLTHYDSPEIIEENVWEMLIDWLAAGIDPSQATLFIQSKVPEHAELHLLMSMITLWVG